MWPAPDDTNGGRHGGHEHTCEDNTQNGEVLYSNMEGRFLEDFVVAVEMQGICMCQELTG